MQEVLLLLLVDVLACLRLNLVLYAGELNLAAQYRHQTDGALLQRRLFEQRNLVGDREQKVCADEVNHRLASVVGRVSDGEGNLRVVLCFLNVCDGALAATVEHRLVFVLVLDRLFVLVHHLASQKRLCGC